MEAFDEFQFVVTSGLLRLGVEGSGKWRSRNVNLHENVAGRGEGRDGWISNQVVPKLPDKLNPFTTACLLC